MIRIYICQKAQRIAWTGSLNTYALCILVLIQPTLPSKDTANCTFVIKLQNYIFWQSLNWSGSTFFHNCQCIPNCMVYQFLSHDNACIRCNIPITYFFICDTCNITWQNYYMCIHRRMFTKWLRTCIR